MKTEEKLKERILKEILKEIKTYNDGLCEGRKQGIERGKQEGRKVEDILKIIDECKSHIEIEKANNVFIDGKKLNQEDSKIVLKSVFDDWISKKELKAKLKKQEK